ncbi:hypothetical protein MYA_4679 [Burkholderia sp. KJ006]|nr:hypothetical protein MYA_4679 [Burkholderia sp. KJ006]
MPPCARPDARTRHAPHPARAAGRDTQRSGPAAARVAHSPGQRPIDRAHDAPTTPPLPPHRTYARKNAPAREAAGANGTTTT